MHLRERVHRYTELRLCVNVLEWNLISSMKDVLIKNFQWFRCCTVDNNSLCEKLEIYALLNSGIMNGMNFDPLYFREI